MTLCVISNWEFSGISQILEEGIDVGNKGVDLPHTGTRSVARITRSIVIDEKNFN